MDKKPTKPKRTHKAKYNEAGHQVGKAARQVWQGVTDQQSKTDTVLNAAGSAAKAVGLGLQGLGLEVINNLTAPPKTKSKRQKKLEEKRQRSQKLFAKQTKKYTPSDEDKRKLAKTAKDPNFKKGITQAQEKRRAVFVASQQVQQETLEAEWQSLEGKRRKPELFWRRADDRGFKRIACQYKSCNQEFLVPHLQLDKYAAYGQSEPRACNECRFERYRLFQETNITRGCEACGRPVTLSVDVWHGKLFGEPNPKFADRCSCSETRRTSKIRAAYERQLDFVRDTNGKRLDLDGRMKEMHNFNFAIGHRYLDPNDEVEQKKREKLLEKKEALTDMFVSGTHHQPVKNLREFDLEFYKNTVKHNGETLYEHIENHLTGVRKADGKECDNSLREHFTSAEEAIKYAHTVAGINDPNQFVDVHRPGQNPTRIDLARGLEIVYTNSLPRHVVTIFKPGYTPGVDRKTGEKADPTPPDLQVLNRIGNKLNSGKKATAKKTQGTKQKKNSRRNRR